MTTAVPSRLFYSGAGAAASRPVVRKASADQRDQLLTRFVLLSDRLGQVHPEQADERTNRLNS